MRMPATIYAVTLGSFARRVIRVMAKPAKSIRETEIIVAADPEADCIRL